MKNLFITLSIFILTVFSGCAYTAAGHKKIMFANSNGWFPSDFDPKTQVLLVPRDDSKYYQQKLVEILSKYPYKYEFYTYNDISKWKDEPKDTFYYKYALVENNWSEKNIYKKPDTYMNNTSNYSDYYFKNISTNINYPVTGYYGYTNYSVLKSIVKYISELPK